MMRIITGSARGTKLLSPDGMATRPTSERAKEATFSSLAMEIPGRFVLDLFAGSGQLALEALSRGADYAYMVENAPEAMRVIRQNVSRTHFEDKVMLCQSDCAVFLRKVHPPRPFDLVFIDPPYAAHLVPDILDTMIQADILADQAIIVCESEEDDVLAGRENLQRIFTVRRKARYAKATVTILEKGKIE